MEGIGREEKQHGTLNDSLVLAETKRSGWFETCRTPDSGLRSEQRRIQFGLAP